MLPGHLATALIGRQAELAALHAQLDRCRSGERPTIFVSGETGIGKTAVIDAFCADLSNAARLRIARGQSLEGFGGKEPFYPVREALNGLNSADEKARALLTAAAPGWFGHNGGSSPSIGEICEALEALSQTDALVLVFEDIHWADSSTLDLISALARRRSRSKLMLLCSFRPAELDAHHPLRLLEQDLRTGRRSEHLSLGPLSKESVATYLRRELAADSLPPGLASLIHQNSTGNPLFMIATLDHLRSQQVVMKRNGQVTLSVPLAEIELGVPDSLSGVIELQLDRLSDGDRSLLEAGSISGTIFPAWAAAAALERELEEVEEAYAALVRRVRSALHRRAGRIAGRVSIELLRLRPCALSGGALCAFTRGPPRPMAPAGRRPAAVHVRRPGGQRGPRNCRAYRCRLPRPQRVMSAV